MQFSPQCSRGAGRRRGYRPAAAPLPSSPSARASRWAADHPTACPRQRLASLPWPGVHSFVLAHFTHSWSHSQQTRPDPVCCVLQANLLHRKCPPSSETPTAGPGAKLTVDPLTSEPPLPATDQLAKAEGGQGFRCPGTTWPSGLLSSPLAHIAERAWGPSC